MTGRGDTLFLFLTERCNLRCRHCHVFGGPDAGISMEPRIARAGLAMACALGIRHVTLTGGEATTHPAFGEVVALALEGGLRVRLITNGKLVLSGRIGTDVLRTLEHTWFSLYGSSRQVHESVAGHGAPDFDRVIDRVAGMQAMDCSVGLSILLVPGATAGTEALLERVCEQGIRSVRMIPLQPDGRAREAFGSDWSGWPAEIKLLAHRLRDAAAVMPLESLTLNDPFDLLDYYGQNRNRSCLLHKRRLWSVVPSGNVYPCCFTAYDDGNRLGNVADSDIISRLKSWEPAAGTPSCRALAPGFWSGADSGCAACPISSISLVNTAGYLPVADSIDHAPALVALP